MSLLLNLRLCLRGRLLCLLLLASGLGGVTPLAASVHPPRESKRNEKRQIEELEEQWRKALIADDVAMADELLAEDYVGISMTGQANTKSQQLERIRNRRLVITSMELSDSRVKIVGPIAIVTCLTRIEGTNEGNSMKGMYRYTRIYQKLPSGVWKTTSFEATRVPEPH